MTTVTTSTVSATSVSDSTVTPRRVHDGEWLKLTGLRSTAWFVVGLALALLGLGVVPALGVAVGALPAGPADLEPLGGALAGLSAAEFVVAGLGILAVTGEYATGVVRTTFTAVPRRAWVVGAKAAVVAEVLLVLTGLALLAAYATATALLGSAGAQPPEPVLDALRQIGEVTLHLTLVGVFGTALGWLTRSTAAGLVTFFLAFYVLPLVGALLPDTVASVVVPLLPGQADPAVLAGWTAAALVAAASTARRRDA
jgi:hypothetical protein